MKETLMCLISTPVTDLQGWGASPAPAMYVVSAKHGIISTTVKHHRPKKQEVEMC